MALSNSKMAPKCLKWIEMGLTSSKCLKRPSNTSKWHKMAPLVLVYSFFLFLPVSSCVFLFLPVSFCFFLFLPVSFSIIQFLLIFGVFSSIFSFSFCFFPSHLVFPASSSFVFKFYSRSLTLIALVF